MCLNPRIAQSVLLSENQTQSDNGGTDIKVTYVFWTTCRYVNNIVCIEVTLPVEIQTQYITFNIIKAPFNVEMSTGEDLTFRFSIEQTLLWW